MGNDLDVILSEELKADEYEIVSFQFFLHLEVSKLVFGRFK